MRRPIFMQRELATGEMPVHQKTVVVVGASGFVGSAVVSAIKRRGHIPIGTAGPRVTSTPGRPFSTTEHSETVRQLENQFRGVGAVINAAGASDSTSTSEESTWGANATLPGIVARAAANSGCRFIHVSTAAVQGRARTLDSTNETQPFSPYSRSKAAGEANALQNGQDVVIYRPPGVHGADRGVTVNIAKLARSAFATVAAPGTDNAPQALIENVADAIAYLALSDGQPPTIVHHPSEGITTADLLSILGDKAPKQLPRGLAEWIIRASYAISRARPALTPHARRLEVLWVGQEQSSSWLSDEGWKPPKGREGWVELRDALPPTI